MAVPLERPLGAPPADLSPATVAGALRRAGVRACCLSQAGDAPAAEPVVSTVGEALEAVVEHNDGYRWESGPEDLVDIFPVPSVLDEQVGEMHIAGKGLWAVLDEDVGLAAHGVELFLEFRDGDGPPVPADLPPGTLRFVLDELIAPLRDAVWDISGQSGAHYLSVTLIA